MKAENLWDKAKEFDIRVSADIVGGFSVGFDENIPENTKNELIKFVYWVEDNFNLPVTLWVDFKYNHYLLDEKKERVGYRFFWVEFEKYPVFEGEENIPVIELPVRTEYWTMEEFLTSFIEAISRYFAWLANMDNHKFTPDASLTEEILQRYLQEA